MATSFPPSPERGPTAGRLRTPRSPRAAARAPLTEGLAYRWERLRDDQRQRVLHLLAQEQQRRRRTRRRLYALLLVLLLIVALGLLLYLVLQGVTF